MDKSLLILVIRLVFKQRLRDPNQSKTSPLTSSTISTSSSTPSHEFTLHFTCRLIYNAPPNDARRHHDINGNEITY